MLVLSSLYEASNIPFCLTVLHYSPTCKHNSLWPRLRTRHLASQVRYLPGTQLYMLRGQKHGWILKQVHDIQCFTLEAVYPTLQPALLPSHWVAKTQISLSYPFVYHLSVLMAGPHAG